MKPIGKSLCLLPLLDDRCCYIISLFDDHKCNLCGEGLSIGLKDAWSTWQWWCMTCAISLLEDSTHINIYAGQCSLEANDSGPFENKWWNTYTYDDYEMEHTTEEDQYSD